MFKNLDIFYKYLGGVAFIIIVLALSGLLRYRHNISTTPKDQNQGVVQLQAGSQDKYKSEFAFSGNRDQQMNFNPGVQKIKIAYSGNGDFYADLLNPDGSLLYNLENRNGAFTEEQSIEILQPNTYTLSVRTAGGWTIAKE